MPGKIIPLFSRRIFDYSDTASGASIETILVKALDASSYTEGTLLVRVHSDTSITGSARFEILVKTTDPSLEDPATDFVVSTAVATATINASISSAKPTLVTASLTSGFGGMLQISLKASQDSTPADIIGELSAELVLKS